MRQLAIEVYGLDPIKDAKAISLWVASLSESAPALFCKLWGSSPMRFNSSFAGSLRLGGTIPTILLWSSSDTARLLWTTTLCPCSRPPLFNLFYFLSHSPSPYYLLSIAPTSFFFTFFWIFPARLQLALTWWLAIVFVFHNSTRCILHSRWWFELILSD
jgi:hypothetical protein